MNGGDRGLEEVRTHALQFHGVLDQLLGVSDRGAIPPGPVLVLEKDELAGDIQAGRTPCFMQEHQCKKAQRLGLLEKLDHQPTQPYRFLA